MLIIARPIKGYALPVKKKTSRQKIGAALLITAVLVGCMAAFALLFPYPNTSVVAPALNLKAGLIVDDGRHNGFPDLIHWQDNFYLAFRAAKNHIDPNSSIKILRSSDAEKWQLVAEMRLDNEDIRDPKFASIRGELFLYALKNKEIGEAPYTTVFSTSTDGVTWTQWRDVSPTNWVFWRPKTDDEKIWYVAADDRKAKRSALFSSTDGMTWSKVSTIYSGEFTAETELAFLANKDILATLRVEGVEGDPRTLIAHSIYPYQTWDIASSHVTRLDGAASFTYHNRVFSVGRFEPRPLFKTGSFLNQKRTAIFHIQANEISWLSDLPSAGDTGYASVVLQNDKAFIVYYTSDPNNDYPWVLGQFKPTQIRMAQIDLNGLEQLSNGH
ncbi:MAG: sialidase family protein [Anaerolineales bacterium]